MSDVSYLEKLIKSSTYDHEYQERLLNQVHELSWSEYDAALADMKLNQLDPVNDMGTASQTQIKDKLLF